MHSVLLSIEHIIGVSFKVIENKYIHVYCASSMAVNDYYAL